ncbi:hypothetical protein VIJ_000901 [Vibrio cholerae RC27]|nr:hypothetical protein VIJ_000901 [Vibrio cholerae RC27]
MAKKPSIELPPFEIPAGYALIAGVDEVGRGPTGGGCRHGSSDP